MSKSIFKDDATTGQKIWFFVWILFEIVWFTKKIRDIREDIAVTKATQKALDEVELQFAIPVPDIPVRRSVFDPTPFVKAESPGTKPYDVVPGFNEFNEEGIDLAKYEEYRDRFVALGTDEDPV